MKLKAGSLASMVVVLVDFVEVVLVFKAEEDFVLNFSANFIEFFPT